MRQVDVRSCSVVSGVPVFFSENRLSSWVRVLSTPYREMVIECEIGFAGVVDTVGKRKKLNIKT